MESDNIIWKVKPIKSIWWLWVHDNYEQDKLKEFRKHGFEPKKMESVDATKDEAQGNIVGEPEFIGDKIVEQTRKIRTKRKFEMMVYQGTTNGVYSKSKNSLHMYVKKYVEVLVTRLSF